MSALAGCSAMAEPIVSQDRITRFAQSFSHMFIARTVLIKSVNDAHNSLGLRGIPALSKKGFAFLLPAPFEMIHVLVLGLKRIGMFSNVEIYLACKSKR